MRIANPTARRGEEIACRYLTSVGYSIIERNFRARNGEIDIIAIDVSEKNDKVLSFIEVKTRTSALYGSPFEAITSWKLRSLTNVAQYYKLLHPQLPEHLRIDAVSVVLGDDGKSTVELLKNISPL